MLAVVLPHQLTGGLGGELPAATAETFGHTFWWAVALIVVAIAAALLLPRRRRG